MVIRDGGAMVDAGRRPFGRLFCLVLMGIMLALSAYGSTPSMTAINDVVYRADGSPAGGNLLISWPAFSTAAGETVAPGNLTVTLQELGALRVNLIPNAGASPTNTVYTVTYQLDDGTAKTEFWSVSAASPTTIAAIRTTLGASSTASQMATKQ